MTISQRAIVLLSREKSLPSEMQMSHQPAAAAHCAPSQRDICMPARSALGGSLKHSRQMAQNNFQDQFRRQKQCTQIPIFNPYCVGGGPCVCMKVITVGFDVVVCPEFSSFRSGSGCSTPLILHMGNPAVIRIGRAGGEIDFICRIIDVTEMPFVWNIKSHFQRLWIKLDWGAGCLFYSMKHYRNREVNIYTAVQASAALHQIKALELAFFPPLFFFCICWCALPQTAACIRSHVEDIQTLEDSYYRKFTLPMFSYNNMCL